ncbi:hypothetical protein BZL41_26325 [Pseudomonas sp. PIC25]|nr:hypothetical protein BZL41_26325 [Pseudomonas sp. PIC25]
MMIAIPDSFSALSQRLTYLLNKPLFDTCFIRLQGSIDLPPRCLRATSAMLLKRKTPLTTSRIRPSTFPDINGAGQGRARYSRSLHFLKQIG